MSIFDYYSIMQSHAGMTDLEIKGVHRTLSRRYHPDRQGGDASKFADIQFAFKQIQNSKARSDLRSKLKVLAVECGQCRGAGFVQERRGFRPIGPRATCSGCAGCGYLPRPARHA